MLIYNDLKSAIQSDALLPGMQLPFERELCDKYSVQRITVRKALDMLVQDGYINKRAGLGSFVCKRETEPEQSGTLLFVMCKSQNDIKSNSSAFNAQLFFIMEQLCRNAGFTLVYAGISDEKELQGLINQYSPSGAFSVSTLENAMLNLLINASIPTLCINHYDARLVSILPDNYDGIRQAVMHLAELGHERIAYIGGMQNSFNAQERQQSFSASLNELMLPRHSEFIVNGDWTSETSFTLVRKMLSSLPDNKRPTALVAASDMMAIGSIQAAVSLGIKVPDRFSVVGFDNIELGKLCVPQITSVGPSAKQMADVSVNHMFDMINRRPSASDKYIVRLPNSFEIRGSSSKVQKDI